MFNINFEMGAVILGVAVSDTCIPECGTDDVGNGADEERNTFIFTVQGKPGGFRYQVYGVSSTGSYSAGLEEGEGRGAGLSLGFGGDNFEILADFSAGTTQCVPVLGCADDVDRANYGVALRAGGFGAQIVSLTTEVGASEEELTGVDVVYHLKSGNVTYGPQFSQEVFDDGTSEVTDSFLYYAISAVF